MEIEQKQADLISNFVSRAGAASAATLAALLAEATSHPSLFAFSEILATPNLSKLEGTQYASSLDLIRLFAYGTWKDYKSNAGSLPSLLPDQICKLKQLSVLTLSETEKVLPYDQLMQELDISNVRELEDFLIECMYVGIIRGKLDQLRRCFEVQFASGRDLKPEQLNGMIQTLENWNLMGNLKHHKDEDVLKGHAVKNQKALWDKALEVRFLLQKAFLNSNRLPQEPVRSSLCNSDREVAQAYSDLVSSSKQTISCMLELEEALLEQNPAIVQAAMENSQDSLEDESFLDEFKRQKDEKWPEIYRMQCRIAPFRNRSIDRWHGRMHVTSGAAAIKNKLHAFNQDISIQVAGYMRDPSTMIKRMQLRRSSVDIFGEVPGEIESNKSESTKEQDENADGDPELLDDSEFYQQLLKEFFESCDLPSSETAFYALRRLQPKKRKLVDRRASKSRKIRYSVHEKIVNFMAPIPMAVPQIAPKLFDNIFGRGN